MEKDNIIYHYTDGAGLKGILDTQSLWATHFRFLNDKSELELFEKMLLDSFRKNYGTREADFDKFKEYLKTVSGLVFDKNFSHLCDIFTFSFCSHNFTDKDIGLLSQWRGYGKDGGYAIGFDYKYLNDFRMAEEKQYNFNFSTLDPVSYWDGANIPEKQKENVDFIFASFMNGQLGEASARYLLCLAHLKHRGFKEENEWRLAFGFSPSTSKKIKFRNFRGTLVPYIELFKKDDPYLQIKKIIIGPSTDADIRKEAIELFKKDTDAPYLPIAKIIIGPSPDAEIRKKSIELLLFKKNYYVKEIVISSIPYRGD